MSKETSRIRIWCHILIFARFTYAVALNGSRHLQRINHVKCSRFQKWVYLDFENFGGLSFLTTVYLSHWLNSQYRTVFMCIDIDEWYLLTNLIAHLQCTTWLHIYNAQLNYTFTMHNLITHLQCTTWLHIYNAQLNYTFTMHNLITHLQCITIIS